ncbi:hypothetical protein G6F59_014044 [Rhizopus arrhizus]|nr:hypothetical protein G6F59_014044 [Rhizopus arrhizus]
MPGHEAPARAAVADVLQVARHRTDGDAIEGQHQQRAQPGQQATGEGAQGDADVVHDVVAEHHPVGTAVAAQALGGGVVHALHRGDLAVVHQHVDQVRIDLGQHEAGQCRQREHRQRHPHAARLAADQQREVGHQEFQRGAPARWTRAVQHAVALLHQLLQALHQLWAVAALAGQAGPRSGHCERPIGIARDHGMGVFRPVRRVELPVQLAGVRPAAGIRYALAGAMGARHRARDLVIANNAEFVAVLGRPQVARIRDAIGALPRTLLPSARPRGRSPAAPAAPFSG